MQQMLPQTAGIVAAFLVLAACFGAETRLQYLADIENAPILESSVRDLTMS